MSFKETVKSRVVRMEGHFGYDDEGRDIYKVSPTTGEGVLWQEYEGNNITKAETSSILVTIEYDEQDRATHTITASLREGGFKHEVWNEYDEDGAVYVKSVVDGVVTEELKKDDQGYEIYSRNDDGETWTEYDDHHNTTFIKSIYFGVTTKIHMEYENDRLVKRVINKSGSDNHEEEEFRYDGHGNEVFNKRTDIYGNVTTTKNTYDDHGNKIRAERINGNDRHQRDIFEYEFDENRNLIRASDNHGWEETNEYDSQNRRIKSFQKSFNGYNTDTWKEYDPETGHTIYSAEAKNLEDFTFYSDILPQKITVVFDNR